jgi:hypothetical protein
VTWRTLDDGTRLCSACWGRHWRAERHSVQVADALAALGLAEPALPAEAGAACVAAAAPNHREMTLLANALVADPACLVSGGSTAPVVVSRLVAAVIAAGGTNVRSPVCADCSRSAWLTQKADGLRICQPCAARRRPEVCVRCGKLRTVTVRNPDGTAVCGSCRMGDPERMEDCSGCGRHALPVRRLGSGPLCSRCYRRPVAECEACGRTRPCSGIRGGRPRCSGCAERRRAYCAFCGRHAEVSAVWAAGPACFTCYERALTTKSACETCGRLRRIDPRDPSGQRRCSDCAGLSPMQVCGACGDEDRLYEKGLCRRCVLTRRVDEILAGPDGAVPAPLVGLRNALAATDPVKAGIKWVARSRNRELLGALAAGTLVLSHHALDALDGSHQVDYLRNVLVATGTLGARDDQLARLETWIGELVAGIEDPAERHMIDTYLTWTLLRRYRQRAARAETTDTGSARGRALRAVELLAWLRAHDTTLAECTQAHIDLWLAGRPSRRYARDFLAWACSHHLATDVSIVRRPAVQPAQPADADRYRALIRTLATDATIATGDRVAGLLVLLYGQTAARVARLSFDDVRVEEAGEVSVRFGDDPCVLPEQVAALVVVLINTTHRGHATVGSPPEARWLFPGSYPGKHINGAGLGTRLAQLGIRSRDARNVAMLNLAVDVPVAIIAERIGLHPRTAGRWALAANGGWADYTGSRLRAEG